MKPVKVSYLGFLPLTRKQYWTILLAAIGVAIACLVVLYAFFPNRAPPFRWPWQPVPSRLKSVAEIIWYHYFWTLLLVCVVAQIIDAAVMMRKFRQKEEEQHRRRMRDGIDD